MNNNFNYKNSMLMILFISMLFPTMLLAQNTGGVDAASMLMATQTSTVSVIKFVNALAFVTGIVMAGFGIWEIRKIGSRSDQGSAKKVFWYLLIGTLLVNFGGTVSIWTNTLGLGNEDTNVLGSSTGGTDPSAAMAGLMAAVFLIIQLIGNITFFRGVWDLKKWSSANGQGAEIWKPLGLIILGSFAINIKETVAIFAGTTGVALPSWLT